MNQEEIKKINSLKQAKYRRQHGLFLVEGTHGVAELLKSRWEIKSLILASEARQTGKFSALLKLAVGRRVPLHVVTRRIFEKLTSIENPQGILAVAKVPKIDPGKLANEERIVIADGISDPGNLGTIVRTAVAFGYAGVITTAGSADLFGDKTVRATQGALFSIVPINHLDTASIIKKLKSTHKFYALTPDAGTAVSAAVPSGRLALIVGAEAHGIGKELLDAADYRIGIPMDKKVESLNAAVSAAIAMYELS